MKLDERARNVELILTDVDGVLTDGGIVFDNQGIETKKFHVRDGLGIRLWQRAGYKFGILTARTSHIVKVRATELSVDVVRQGFEDKLPVVKELLGELELEATQLCFIGDDLTDLAAIQFAGFGVAVADAVEEVQQAAAYTTTAEGGNGAVRETVETLLKAKKKWDDIIRKYQAP